MVYHIPMIRTLQSISGFFFYALGFTFFFSFLFWRNAIAGGWPLWWLQIADLPLLISGLLYGGSSLYLSLKRSKKGSPVLATLIIFVALLVLFGALTLNFWEQFGQSIIMGMVNRI